MNNQLDYINLAPTAGAEQIAAGAASFAQSMGKAAAAIGEQASKARKEKEDSINSWNKEYNKVLNSARNEILKQRNDTLISFDNEEAREQFKTESLKLAEDAWNAQVKLTPPYDQGLNDESRQLYQAQYDKWVEYMNTSKNFNGNLLQAGEAYRALQGETETIIYPDEYDPQNHEDYGKAKTQGLIIANYLAHGVHPGVEVKQETKTNENGSATKTFVFTKKDTKEQFRYTVGGGKNSLILGESLPKEDQTTISLATVKDDKGNIKEDLLYGLSGSVLDTGNQTEAVQQKKYINGQVVYDTFRDDVRGDIKSVFSEGRDSVLRYFDNYLKMPKALDDVIQVLKNDTYSEDEFLNQLTELAVNGKIGEDGEIDYNGLWGKVAQSYHEREATDEDIKAAEQAGVTLREVEGKKYVYSIVKTGDVKQKRKETGDEQTVVEENTQMIKDNWLKSGQELATPNRKFIGMPVDANGNEIQDRDQIPVGYRLMMTGVKEGTTMTMPVSSTDKIYKDVDEFLGAIGRLQKFEGLNTN